MCIRDRQELAHLVAEALERGDSRESVIADLSKNGLPDDDAEELVNLVEYQMYQIDTGPAQHGGGGEGMSWLIWVGAIILIRILSQLFN